MFVGIVSPNFSGSTVVGSILHRFSKVQHVGEFWRILSNNPNNKAYCTECRPNECVYFSNDVMSDIANSSKKDIVFKVNEIFGSSVMVSGDKRPEYYERMTGMPDKVLVIVKNKYSAALSYAKRMNGFNDASDVERDDMIYQAAVNYFSTLSERIKWVESNYTYDDYLLASPDVIAEAEDNTLMKIGCDLFGSEVALEMVLSPTPFDQKFHYIGGNHKVSKGKDHDFFKGRFSADLRHETMLSESDLKLIDAAEKEFFYIPKSVRDGVKTNYLDSWVIDSSGLVS